MSVRKWTVVIVPNGSDAPRTLTVSERLVRHLAWGGGIMALTMLLVTVVTIVRFAGPSGLSSLMTPAERQLVELRTRMAELRDTITSLDKRNEKIRLLAGLPNPDSGLVPEQIPLDVDTLIVRANSLSASFEEVSTSLSKNNARLSATPSIMPTTGWLSSQFSRARFHPILHLSRPHEGIDVAAPYGAPVVAPAAGVVLRISRQTGYGLVLEIDHGNGIETKYAHLSRVVVRPGQRVTRGQPIAAVGNSGLSTGPHLHYEVHVNGRVVDPLTYVLPGAIPD